MRYTPDEVEATHRCQDLERSLGLQPSARVTCHAGAMERRWRVECDLSFSVDGSTENTQRATALVAVGATAVEALSAFHHFMHDPDAKAFYFERHKIGMPLDEPYPMSPAELEGRAKMREHAKKAAEIQMEGARKHIHNQLKHYGLLDAAKKYHRKTGRLRLLFDKMFS